MTLPAPGTVIEPLLVWQVHLPSACTSAVSRLSDAMALRGIRCEALDGTIAPPGAAGRPAMVHLHGAPSSLHRSWVDLLAELPYLIELDAADLASPSRRPWDPRARRVLQGAHLVVVPEVELLWRLAKIKHLPPTRALPPVQAASELEPAVVDLRDDGSLLGDWCFEIWDEPADPASILASIYRSLI